MDNAQEYYQRTNWSEGRIWIPLAWFTAVFIFGTACNWFPASNPFGKADDSQPTPVSPVPAETAPLSGTVIDDVSSETDPASVKSVGDLMSDTSTQLNINSIDGNSDETISEALEQIQDGLSSRKASVPLTVGKVLAGSAPAPENETVATGAAVLTTSRQLPQASVSDDLVNIRSGPDTLFPIVSQALLGQLFEIRGRSESGDWLQVCCLGSDDSEGWIFAELLTLPDELLNNPSAISVIDSPEPPAAAAVPVPGNSTTTSASQSERVPANGGFQSQGGINPLTGYPFSGGHSGQRPVIVCINNDFAARPQLGTNQADVMYEYLMEGYGITRFSGVFYGNAAPEIGPIRSARLVNYYMAILYDAGLACSGASDRVRYILKHESPFPYLDVDLDDPSNALYTTSAGSDYRTRLRTSGQGLSRWLADWGAQRAAAIREFTFGEMNGGAAATAIYIPYPGTSGVGYDYNAANGTYFRRLGGLPHLDGADGSQVNVENVVIQYVPHENTDIVEDSLGSLSIRLNLFGSGRAMVFRDGQAFEGTWRSESGGDMPRFFLLDGREILLKRGQTWISIVPLSYGIEFS